MEIKQVITIAVLALVFWSWICWGLGRWADRHYPARWPRPDIDDSIRT